MAFNKGDKSDSSRVRRGGMHRRKKVCVFCGDKNGEIDYKDVNKLKRYVSERGKILIIDGSVLISTEYTNFFSSAHSAWSSHLSAIWSVCFIKCHWCCPPLLLTMEHPS